MPSKSPLIKVLVLFIVGIILPTGFLVYLGVLSIRSETLLLRKESQERVGKTAQAIQAQMQTMIGEALAPLAHLSKNATQAALSDFQRATGAVSMLLVIGPNNRLLYPIQESRRQSATAPTPLSPEKRQRLEQAEQAEFKNHDYASALLAYRSLLKDTDNPRWKAVLLTSIAGSLMKLGQHDAAEAQYQEIVTRYSQEPDQEGYPFGLVIASQLGELQQAKGRPDLAIASHLRVFQDLMAGRWDLSWEESQFFARHLTQRIQALREHISGGDRSRWQTLQAQWDHLKQAALQAQDFMRRRWQTLQRTLREQDRNGAPFIVFTDAHAGRAVAYAPSYESKSEALQYSVVADIDTEPLITKLHQTAGQLTSASNLTYRLELTPGTILAESDQKPEGKRWPIESQLAQTYPSLRLAIAPVSDVPVERAAARRRQVYVGMVVLAAMVVLIALYATWYAVSREIEVAQLKARFVASMSHELKTPLSIIGLIGQKLKLGRYSSESEAQEYYGMLAEETERLKTMIEDVLDFSRLLENRQPYKKEPTDLIDLVRDTIDRCRQSHPTQNLDIQVMSSAGEYIVPADREAMSRVLMNLLENAIKYSPPDHLRIRVSLRNDGSGVWMEVQDEGYGIPPDEQRLVFERFYRGKSAVEHHQTNGVGLGLSIVKHIVHAHTGTVELRSAEGQGSAFIIRLPF